MITERQALLALWNDRLRPPPPIILGQAVLVMIELEISGFAIMKNHKIVKMVKEILPTSHQSKNSSLLNILEQTRFHYNSTHLWYSA